MFKMIKKIKNRWGHTKKVLNLLEEARLLKESVRSTTHCTIRLPQNGGSIEAPILSPVLSKMSSAELQEIRTLRKEMMHRERNNAVLTVRGRGTLH